MKPPPCVCGHLRDRHGGWSGRCYECGCPEHRWPYEPGLTVGDVVFAVGMAVIAACAHYLVMTVITRW